MESAENVTRTEVERPRPSTILSALSFYFIGIGALYLWGYWDSYGVNIMEYLGLSDVVKVAAWPVLSAFVFLFVGMLLGELFPLPHLPEGGGSDTAFGRKLKRYRTVVTWAFIVLIAALIAFGPPSSWQGVGLLLGVVLAKPLRQLRVFEQLVPDTRMRSILAFAAVVLPLWSFGQGRLNAETIRSGYKYQYVLPDSEGVSGTTDPATSMRYVGFAGSTFFFWDPAAESLTVVPASSVKTLKLSKKPRDKQSTFDWIKGLIGK